MVAVAAAEADVRPLLGERVSLAAVNGPSAVVLSGDEDAVLAAAAELAARGHRTKRLTVSHAFHSARIEPMLAEFGRVASGLSYADAKIPVVSTLTGRLATAELGTPEYWLRHAREVVRFADGVRTLEAAGVTDFVELGPAGVLTEQARATGAHADVVPAQRGARSETAALLRALAALHVTGREVAWAAIFAPWDGNRVELPTYPFQRASYWLPDRRDILTAGPVAERVPERGTGDPLVPLDLVRGAGGGRGGGGGAR
ncbi:acyltransferase domain-containing protein, partial [Amycolatopsis solani]|uniref:acyltransferase domain-containing protein n=1 Tax=Amycolatopsis solani TaxID=3028615 RepID=UPI0025B05AD9